jgi:hypothetical protein
MAITLTGIVVRHERRLRLVFSSPLGSGAFNPNPYALTSLDAKALAPAVRAALIVADNSANVELTLGGDLVPGAAYRVTCTAVPALDGLSSYTGTGPFSLGFAQSEADKEVQNELDAVIYGRDLWWDGQDLREGIDGDLALVTGSDNVHDALTRRLASGPLLYDSTYSPRLRDFVDGPATGLGSVKGAILSSLRLDDRVKGVKVDVRFDDANSATAWVDVSVTLVGDQALADISVPLTT